MQIEKNLGIGSVRELWRYPVKSMLGEQLGTVTVTERGLQGDRRFALLDRETGHVVSAKNPKRWPSLFTFQARLLPGASMGVEITLPDGRIVTEPLREVDAVLSQQLGRTVMLTTVPPAQPMLEQYLPSLDGLVERDSETTAKILPATFFDEAPVHILTTATLEALQSRYPDGRVDARRFRPNVVIDTGTSAPIFLENDWKGRVLAIGAHVRLAVTSLCARCVMTTLPQHDLPQDREILRTAVQHNHGMVGVLATVLTPGFVQAGDIVRLEE
ncbi:MAG: MOSC domain-containing protein [Nitrospirota bacterium]|nr:MOSC domain-containing protein [Nitrospirota bacterium]